MMTSVDASGHGVMEALLSKSRRFAFALPNTVSFESFWWSAVTES